MSEESLAAQFLGRPDPHRRKTGIRVGGAGLLLFLGAAVAAALVPPELLPVPVVAMVAGLALLAAGYLRLR